MLNTVNSRALSSIEQWHPFLDFWLFIRKWKENEVNLAKYYNLQRATHKGYFLNYWSENLNSRQSRKGWILAFMLLATHIYYESIIWRWSFFQWRKKIPSIYWSHVAVEYLPFDILHGAYRLASSSFIQFLKVINSLKKSKVFNWN